MTRASDQHKDPVAGRRLAPKIPKAPKILKTPETPKRPGRNCGQKQSSVVSARRMPSSSPDGNPEPGPSPGYLAARRPASRKPA